MASFTTLGKADTSAALAGLAGVALADGSGGGVEDFVHAVADMLCGCGQPSTDALAALYTTSSGGGGGGGDDGNSASAALVAGVGAFLSSCADDEVYADESAVAARAAAQGCADAGAAKALASAAAARGAEVREALRKQAVKISRRHLVDFDWSTRVVCGSDTAAGLSKPVTLLKLRLGKNGDDEDAEEHLLELDRKGIETILASLEAAAASMKQFADT